MRRTFKYRARITKEIQAKCNEWLYLSRTLYNLALEQRILVYKQNKKSLSYFDQQYQLPEFKKTFPEFKIVCAQVLRDVIKRLDRAYKAFFKNSGFPRFKSADRYHSFTLRQNSWKLKGRYLYITNIGRFKLFLSRPIEGNIKEITIKRTSIGNWFVSFSCDNVPECELPPTGKEVGIDVGIKSFCVDSDGNKFDNPRYFHNSEKVLRRRQRSLSRKKRGSNRRKKAKLLVAKTHEKIHNQRMDFLHKTSHYYIKNYDKIFIEDLKITDMLGNKYLSKSISDCGWGTFFNMLSYKAEGAGREVVKVDPRNTTQICSGCGKIVFKSLSIRIHKCQFCGLVLDRDHNAAINILRFGQSLQALTPALADVA